MTRKWLRERQRDVYHRRAKEYGFRSRAVFKLLEAAKKYDLMKPGDVVVDLGAFPGGWLQGARSLVGDAGFVLGIDLEAIKPLPWPNVKTLVDDLTRVEGGEILKHLPRRADVVLSDASPNISGIWEVDHARQMDLARHAVELAGTILRRDGNLMVKAFQGEFFKGFLEAVKTDFRFVKVFKPKASRKRSAEVYIVALGLGLRGRRYRPSRYAVRV